MPYEIVIGLEIHVQLNTLSKAFCADDASYGGEPNTHISVVSLGHPGTLPLPNKKQIEYATRLGLAMGCTINQSNFFDRKNYFYADLPKGYQITQDKQPICIGGGVTIKTDEGEKMIRLTRIHMEEDAGKSIHDLSPSQSFLDFNRAGVPLLEIVTEPDLRSADEAYALLTEIRRLIQWVGVSDGNMEEGSMRCDCNISIRPLGQKEYGTRCEIKNVNSIRNAKRAIEYEANRQINLLESGGEVVQQTRSYDAVNNHTNIILRDKEDAHDYRYFPEPDIPPIVIGDEELEAIRANLPKLPKDLFARFTTDMGLSDYDADILTSDKATADLFLALSQKNKNYKAAANLIINPIRSYLNEKGWESNQLDISVEKLQSFIELIESNKVSAAIAYQRIFPELPLQKDKTPLQIAEGLGLIQNADEDFLVTIVEAVIAKYPDKVAIYRKGKKGLLGFFMGEVMKASKGKAEPKATNQLLREKLG